MPEKQTVDRAKKASRTGKQPTTAAGEFVREEMEHSRRGARRAQARRRVSGFEAGMVEAGPRRRRASPACRRRTLHALPRKPRRAVRCRGC